MSFNRNSPTSRTGHVAVSYKNYVYVWGGYRENEDFVNSYFPSWELSVYCAVTETWSTKTCSTTDGPPGMSGSFAALLNDYMYLFGGYCHDVSSNNLYRLCLKSFVWERLYPSGPSPYPVDKTTLWQHEGKLYTFGGFGSSSSPGSHNNAFQFVFDHSISDNMWRGWTNQFYQYDPEKNEWIIPKFTGELPIPRAAHAAAVVKCKVYIFGGRHDRRRMSDLHCFDMVTMKWSGRLRITGAEPEGRSWHSFTTVSDSYILLYGGFSLDSKPLSDCWLFNTEMLSWQPILCPFTKPRLWHSSCLTINNDVMIFGGCASNIFLRETRPRHTNDVILIRISPKSLLRLCLDRVGELPELMSHWCMLPRSLQTILNARHCVARATSLDGS